MQGFTHLATFLVGFLLISLEPVFLHAFGISGWSFNWSVIIMVYLAAFREFTTGSLIFIALAYFCDIVSGGPLGVSSMSLVLLYIPVRLLNEKFLSPGVLPQTGAAIVASLLYNLLSLGIVSLLYHKSSFLFVLPWTFLFSALACGVSAFIFILLLTKIDPSLSGDRPISM